MNIKYLIEKYKDVEVLISKSIFYGLYGSTTIEFILTDNWIDVFKINEEELENELLSIMESKYNLTKHNYAISTNSNRAIIYSNGDCLEYYDPVKTSIEKEFKIKVK
jgi:hypothetical protein